MDDALPFRFIAITPGVDPPSPEFVRTWVDAGVAEPGRGLAVLVRMAGARLQHVVTRVRGDLAWSLFLDACREAGFPVLAGLGYEPALRLGDALAAEPRFSGVQVRSDPSDHVLRHVRSQLDGASIVGRSCHGGEAGNGGPTRADYSCVAPIFAPKTRQMGHKKTAGGLGMLASRVGEDPEHPIFALGGVDGGTAAACMEAGAYGLAGISTFFGERAAVREHVRRLCDAVTASAVAR
ncbi:MAG: thiamine phosphate synthase [Nannocystaceae bacterium]